MCIVRGLSAMYNYVEKTLSGSSACRTNTLEPAAEILFDFNEASAGVVEQCAFGEKMRNAY